MPQFYRFVKGTKSLDLNSKHVADFITYLTIARKVAKSTQSRAFNAILFFFRHVLKQDITDSWSAIRSKRKQRLPVVLSVNEVLRLFHKLLPVLGKDADVTLLTALFHADGFAAFEAGGAHERVTLSG